MVKSRRFNKRVQKRQTRKHKTTRKKNRVSKKYSRKQRGGVDPLIATAVGIGAAIVLGSGFFGAGYGLHWYLDKKESDPYSEKGLNWATLEHPQYGFERPEKGRNTSRSR